MYVHHVRRALKKADCLRLCYVQIELCLALADMLDFKQPWTWSDMTKEGGVFHFFLVDMQSNNFWLKNQNKVKLRRIDQPNNQPSTISEIAWNGLINMCKLSK